MNINKIILNDVKNRFLPIPKSTINSDNHEPKITEFEIIKELGEGSFGRVFLVVHKKTEIKYALKAIDKRDKTNIKERPYFHREIEIMYKINHPKVIKLFGHFEDELFCYFIMEYAPNGNLYSLIPKRGKKKQNNKTIASLIKDVISAVYYMHKMNPPIIHRDIKPENVLLDENYQAKLTDFGWSNYLNDSDKRNTICGTPIYLAPEMINKRGHDEKIDIWCIGVLLFEIITGSIPFHGENIHILKHNIKHMKIKWPSNIGYEEKDLISRILRYNPNDRLTLEEILEHKFFKRFFPNAKNDLILPNNMNSEDREITNDENNERNFEFNMDLYIKDSYSNNKENGSNNYSTNENSCESKNINGNSKNDIIYDYEDYKSLLKKYENLKRDYDMIIFKRTELKKRKEELKKKDNYINQLIKNEYLKKNNKRTKIIELKSKYNKLYKENMELREKLDYYNNYTYNIIIKIKEKSFEKYKEDDNVIKEKEKEKLNIIINKYDKALYEEEKKNETLKLRLKNLIGQ